MHNNHTSTLTIPPHLRCLHLRCLPTYAKAASPLTPPVHGRECRGRTGCRGDPAAMAAQAGRVSLASRAPRGRQGVRGCAGRRAQQVPMGPTVLRGGMGRRASRACRGDVVCPASRDCQAPSARRAPRVRPERPACRDRLVSKVHAGCAGRRASVVCKARLAPPDRKAPMVPLVSPVLPPWCVSQRGGAFQGF